MDFLGWGGGLFWLLLASGSLSQVMMPVRDAMREQNR